MNKQNTNNPQGNFRREVVNEMTKIRNKSVKLLNRVNEAQKALPRQVSDQIAIEVLGMPFDQFYRQTGLMVGPADFDKLIRYFQRCKEEEQKMNVVESLVRKVLKEDYGFDGAGPDVNDVGPAEEGGDDGQENEYDPWLNGDASYMDGEYDIPYGFHVTIDSGLGYVAIDNPNNPDESYFLQGDEADDLIKQISKYWADNDCQQIEAINTIIQGQF